MARILVIDDEEDVLRAVTRRLERAGHEVTPAANSEQGILKIQKAEQPYDVVLTDMSMEDAESGLKVLAAAFARDILAEVIVMTAYGNVENAVECMKRGAFDYVEKNKPGADMYDVLAEKVGLALAMRRRDLRTLDRVDRILEESITAR